TNVAARGIHVDHLDLVVNVDPPTDHKDYLHRGGRTARAGESGSVVTPQEARHHLPRPTPPRRSPPRTPATVHNQHARIEPSRCGAQGWSSWPNGFPWHFARLPQVRVRFRPPHHCR
ncbi:helicase-related protein, partial [Streptomyces sp.]|uniref:helicase-related protein n=1 Tax=Streptomyces sp. TaxID=1931 RepID=UPI002D36BB19